MIHLRKTQVKENHIVRLLFYCTSFGRETESAKPLLNALDMLIVDNIYRLEVQYLTIYFNMLEICIDTTQDIQLNIVFIRIKLELTQEYNRFLT